MSTKDEDKDKDKDKEINYEFHHCCKHGIRINRYCPMCARGE